MPGAIPPHYQYDYMAWCSFKKITGITLALPLPLTLHLPLLYLYRHHNSGQNRNLTTAKSVVWKSQVVRGCI